ncbi:MAG: hypothetical protein JWR75_1568 [Devosia sp.]|nr:hypothetical protein [Devosia sp.]
MLWERIKGGMRLAALDPAASAAGLFVGQSLADARALVPNLAVREIDRAFLDRKFADFADWHSNASPLVAALPDQAAWGDLILDITGVAHLFGGEAAMLETVISRLSRQGFTVAGSVADSVGAAWALAHYAPGTIEDGDAATALAELPVAALRLDEHEITALLQLGLKRIGQLYGRDRKALQARFGVRLVNRLDQALGRVEERITPRLPLIDLFAEQRFAEPVGLIDDVLMCTADLAVRLAHTLELKNLGAQTFHLFLYRVDHQVMTLSINASRATRDSGHIARLFANRAERLAGEYDAGFGIDCIRLAASSLTETAALQLGAFGTSEASADLDRLYDRMTSRLGPLAVVHSRFVDTHIPERAVRLEPVIARTPPIAVTPPDAAQLRPLRLLPAPEPIEVIAAVPDGPPATMIWRRITYRFAKASGPERIEAEWWRSGRKLDVLDPPRTRSAVIDPKTTLHLPKLEAFEAEATLRDYYVAEDDGGRRFWIFRRGLYGANATPGWFMHGIFA